MNTHGLLVTRGGCCMPSSSQASRRPLGFSYSWDRRRRMWTDWFELIVRSRTQAMFSLVRRRRWARGSPIASYCPAQERAEDPRIHARPCRSCEQLGVGNLLLICLASTDWRDHSPSDLGVSTLASRCTNARIGYRGDRADRWRARSLTRWSALDWHEWQG